MLSFVYIFAVISLHEVGVMRFWAIFVLSPEAVENYMEREKTGLHRKCNF